MRGKARKEQVLIVGIILALLVALGQLGMLIYRTYNTSTEEKDYIGLSFNEYSNLEIEVRQADKEIPPNEQK